jgi:hypothetical protein
MFRAMLVLAAAGALALPAVASAKPPTFIDGVQALTDRNRRSRTRKPGT